MGYIPQSKCIWWLNGLYSKTQLYAVLKKLTPDLRTHVLKVKGWKVYSRQMKTKRKAEIIISMSDKIESYNETKSLHNDKVAKSSREYNYKIYTSKKPKKTYINGKISIVHGSEKLRLLKCSYHPKLSIDSM